MVVEGILLTRSREAAKPRRRGRCVTRSHEEHEDVALAAKPLSSARLRHPRRANDQQACGLEDIFRVFV